ncbi:hypothetical protein ACU8MT_09150 [Rhizobium leguminosarum]
MLRSLICAGLAMVAIGLCTTMPAAAAVPIEVNAIVQPLAAKDYPAPAIAVVEQDVAVLPSLMSAIAGDGSGRSSIFDSSQSFASTSATVAPYQLIDPDIAG